MTIVEQVKNQLKDEIKQAVLNAKLAEEAELPEIILEVPKEKSHGDYATNMAMQLARIARKAPRQIAEEITKHINEQDSVIERVEVAGPGFINFFLNNRYLTNLIPTILKENDHYGETKTGQGTKVQIEFVSANPTGSLHLGHARGAAVGDALAHIMQKAGYEVSREYYINDAGNQITNMAQSIEARYLQALGIDHPMPEDGYHGQDIVQFGQALAEERGDELTKLSGEEKLAFFREYGLERLIDKIKVDLNDYRVGFDVWFSETSLYKSGEIETVLEKLKASGYTYEQDGALWFASTKFGDDKDRVLIKSDGSYTYLTPDIAYHLNKFNRGFDTLINIWGADHHGYIPRMKASIQALGYLQDQLEVVIIQMVNLIKDGEKVKMSKRTGKAVTLRELMEEVGIDAMRYFFAMRSSDSHLDFDIDLALSQTNENPVYYVQYAYARISSMLRQADESLTKPVEDLNLATINSEKEIDLLKKLGEFPEAVAEAAERRATQRITHYLFELASTLHSFYNAERVLDPEDEEKSAARVALMKAVRITLRNGFKLIGVSAPEKM